MKRINQFMICLLICLGLINHSFAQKKDTTKTGKENSTKPYFIIAAGDQINAFFNDKPVSASTIEEFKDYVQANIKSLKDSWVVVTGKPKSGTYDEVIKTLSKYRFKNVSKNILKE